MIWHYLGVKTQITGLARVRKAPFPKKKKWSILAPSLLQWGRYKNALQVFICWKGGDT